MMNTFSLVAITENHPNIPKVTTLVTLKNVSLWCTLLQIRAVALRTLSNKTLTGPDYCIPSGHKIR